MVAWKDGYLYSPALMGRGEGVPTSRVLARPVAVEAQDGRAGMHVDHTTKLNSRQLPAGLGDRAEPIGLAGADGSDGDRHGVERSLDDHDLSGSVGGWR